MGSQYSPIQIEVPKRGFYRHIIKVEKAGHKIIWDFSTLKKDIGFGVSMRIDPDSDAKGFKEVVQLHKYDSHRKTIKGCLVVEEPGVYCLLWDNTFSRLTPKRLTFHAYVRTEQDAENNPDITGWLLKRKKQIGIQKAWSKRWFTMSRGILQYFKDENSYCRGTVDVSTATITVNKRSLQISIDNGKELFHLKALQTEHFEAWVRELEKHREIQHSQIEMVRESSDLEALKPLTLKEISAKLEKAEKDLESLEVTFKPSSFPPSSSSYDFGSIANVEKKLSIRKKKSPRKGSESEENETSIVINSLREIIDNLKVVVAELSDKDEDDKGKVDKLDKLESKAIGKIRSHKRIPSVSSYHSNHSRDQDVFYDAPEILVKSDDDEGSSGVDEVVEEESDEDGFFDEEPQEKSTLGTKSMITRRTRLPAKTPQSDFNIINLLKKNIGKDLSKVSMPVSLNEPLSMLQRLTEELEYVDLLDKASTSSNSIERMLQVCAFAVSGYASTFWRPLRKPFNPLLGETYECVRQDRGFKFISEKVSHHPLIIACHAESDSWVFWQDQRPKSKFWGKSIEFESVGTIHLKLKKTGDYFTWSKVTTCMRNIFSDVRNIEHYGDMIITNHTTGETAKINFKQTTYFTSSNNEVTGAIYDSNENQVFNVSGKWNEFLQWEVEQGKFVYLWKAQAPPSNAHEQYGFSQFAMELNEITEEERDKIPSTDTRLRRDQRLLEEGRVDDAEMEKIRLEEKQRRSRKEREESGIEWKPLWFKTNDNGEYVFKEKYWEKRETKSFPNVDIF